MRYALISDIHANLVALEAVLNSIANQPEIDAAYHLGDLVGYGPWPNETIALLKGFRITGIMGNHDQTIATSAAPASGASHAPLSHGAWTARETTDENRALLARLPFRMDLRPRGGHVPGPTVFLFHGTPVAIDAYWHGDATESFCREMATIAGARAGDVVCCGHTHLPWHREVDGVHLVNTGSVGRPKDGDWRAGYVTLDMSGDVAAVEFVRVEYDVHRAAEEIRRSGLPDEFADFLLSGGATGAAAAAPGRPVAPPLRGTTASERPGRAPRPPHP